MKQAESICGTKPGEIFCRGVPAAETAWAFLTRTPRPTEFPFSVREVDWSRVEDQPLLRDDKGSLFFNLSFSATPPLQD